jgi:DNA-binding PadR family transcriptional regulator
MYSNELIKGTLQTIVLQLLMENGRMYGYEITQRVKEETQDKIQLTEGALYPLLHKLEAEKLLRTETMKVDGRVRKYYSLTKEGKAKAKSKVKEFADFLKTMKELLNLKPGYQV